MSFLFEKSRVFLFPSFVSFYRFLYTFEFSFAYFAIQWLFLTFSLELFAGNWRTADQDLSLAYAPRLTAAFVTAHLSNILYIWMILGGHKHHYYPIDELNTRQWTNTKIEQYTKHDWDGNTMKSWSEENGHPCNKAIRPLRVVKLKPKWVSTIWIS